MSLRTREEIIEALRDAGVLRIEKGKYLGCEAIIYYAKMRRNKKIMKILFTLSDDFKFINTHSMKHYILVLGKE